MMGLDLLVFAKLCRVQEPPMGNSEHTESLRAAHISFEAGVVPHIRGSRHKSKGSREPKPGNCQTGPANSATGSVLEVTRRLRGSLTSAIHRNRQPRSRNRTWPQFGQYRSRMKQAHSHLHPCRRNQKRLHESRRHSSPGRCLLLAIVEGIGSHTKKALSQGRGLRA